MVSRPPRTEVDKALLSFVVLQQVCQGSGSWEAGLEHIHYSCCFKTHFGLVCDRNWKQRLSAMRLWGTTALWFFAILFLFLAPPTRARTAPSANLRTQAQELGIAQPFRDGDSTSLHSAVAEKALNPTTKVITEPYLLFLSGESLIWNSLLQVINTGAARLPAKERTFRRWWCSCSTCWDWILSTSEFGHLAFLKFVLIRNTGGLNVAGWWN